MPLCLRPILVSTYIDGFLGRLTVSMTHLYLFLAEPAPESVLAVHHPLVPTLNTENPILCLPLQRT
jgi:hypothetical protein